MARSTPSFRGAHRAGPLPNYNARAVPVVIEWVEWSDDEAAARWNAVLETFPTYNLYQSFEWGEYKRRAGWSVFRGSVLVDGRTQLLVQGMCRSVRAIRGLFVWVPGGPAGDLSAGLDLGPCLRQRFGARYVFLRMNILHESYGTDVKALAGAGWHPASVRVGYPSTFHVDLTRGEVVRRGALTANWRHNLKRGEERGGRVEMWDAQRPLAPVYEVYQEMCRLQRIPVAISLEGFEAMRCSLGDAMTLVVALDRGDQVSAMRSFGRIGERAYDLMAAVTTEGRRTYANYPLMWRVLDLAQEQGVRLYDMSGADPQGAIGVFHFKKGLGGRLVTYMGEWDWGSHGWLRRLVNVGVRARRRAL